MATGAVAKRTSPNPNGKPPKYKDPSEMEGLIDAYFKECEGEVLKDDDGKPILNKYGMPIILGQRPPTVTGLALALGFESRTSLLNYQNRSAGFNRVLSRAKMRIEMYTEERLFDKDGANGAKFSLQNNFRGWNDPKDAGNSDGGTAVKIICDIPITTPAPAASGDNDADSTG